MLFLVVLFELLLAGQQVEPLATYKSDSIGKLEWAKSRATTVQLSSVMAG